LPKHAGIKEKQPRGKSHRQMAATARFPVRAAVCRALVPIVTAKSSESEMPNVSPSTTSRPQNAPVAEPQKDRWWLADPWRMADGSYY
jgi:hypothetical protein